MAAEWLTASQLVEKTKHELERPFKGEIFVTPPSDLFLETQRVAEDKGCGFLKPIYFPLGVTGLDSASPKGWIKLEEWFFKQIRERKIRQDATRIGAFWALFDDSKRPSYHNGIQMFKNDQQFGLILVRGREIGGKKGGIAVPDHLKYVPNNSRFGVSINGQDRFVFPELAKLLCLVDRIREGIVVIRRPKAAEFNFAGNLRYPHLGQVDTLEVFEDIFKGARGGHLYGGYSAHGGLADVSEDPFDYCDDYIAFRPLVAFPSSNPSLVAW